MPPGNSEETDNLDTFNGGVCQLKINFTPAASEPQDAFVTGTFVPTDFRYRHCRVYRHASESEFKQMVKVKKSADVGGGGAQRLDILAARVRIIEAELILEEKQVELPDGRSFVAEPNLNCKFVIVANLINPGVHEGAEFFDRFKLKRDEDEEWVFAKYSKLGTLITIRYGEGWFSDPTAEFEESDFEEFELIARIQPKTDPHGKELKSSVIDWESMRSAGGREEKAVKEKAAEAEAEEDLDFQDLPF